MNEKLNYMSWNNIQLQIIIASVRDTGKSTEDTKLHVKKT